MQVVMINPTAVGMPEDPIASFRLLWQLDKGGFSVEIINPGGVDFRTYFEQVRRVAQQWVDLYARKGRTLQWVLQRASARLNTIAESKALTNTTAGQKPTEDENKLIGQVLMYLMILRSFGLVPDEDDYNGILIMSVGQPYAVPEVKWNGK